jgi:lactate dehydrogenase-like 2-hydroxyacid dehydrogenase
MFRWGGDFSDMKLLITRTMPDRVLAAAKARFDVTLRDTESAVLTPEELRASLRDYDVVMPTLGDRYQADVFADVPAPRAKLLANFGVGYNHIDVDAASAAGVLVTNTPGAVTDATADIALSLILMTARRLGEGERLLRAGQWQGWGPTQMLGTHVSGKSVGIIGMGRIGKAIARRCHFGFGMEVVFHNRSAVADAGVPARQAGMDEVMAQDFVVVAVPGGKATHHLINAAAFAAMKPTGIFVNIARGDVVDEAALIAALAAGQIAGAGLDVYEFEPKVPPALMGLENVTLLPHLGTAALEVRENMGMMAVANLIAHLDGHALPDKVG